ncbi:ABC transporter substrate-binding protein, partial [Bacteroidota bacterium]
MEKIIMKHLTKRKITIGLLISCLLFTQNIMSNTNEKVQIKWYLQLNNDESDPNSSAFYQYVEMYNNSQDRIEVVIVPSYAGCSFDATDTLLMYIEQGNSPDIISYRYSELWEHLLDLTPYLSNYDLSNVDSSYFFKYKVNNRLLYVNLGISPFVLYYNKDLFDSAGLAYPLHEYGANYSDGDPWDIDKLEELAMKLTLDTGNRNALDPNFDDTQIEQYGFHWEWANGLSFINMFGLPSIVNSDSVVSVPDYMRDGYRWVHDAIWNKHFIPSMEVFESYNYDPLGSGKVAMCFDDPHCDTINWDIAVIPSYKGELHLPWADVLFGILNTCQHPEEALEVIFTIANTIEFYNDLIP